MLWLRIPAEYHPGELPYPPDPPYVFGVPESHDKYPCFHSRKSLFVNKRQKKIFLN